MKLLNELMKLSALLEDECKSHITQLTEVKVRNDHQQHPDKPLKDTDSILVYHGTSNLQFCYDILTRGISANIKQDRKYSYELNNNPNGLFVSPSFSTAKHFGKYVIEFHSTVGDLEAPVWPDGSSFTVQGGYSKTFSDDKDRNEERLQRRKQLSSSENETIAKSDRPELAHSLYASGEPQALFVGSLNPNSIRAVWVKYDGNNTYSRLDRNNFLKYYNSQDNKSNSTNSQYDNEQVVKPRDMPTGAEFMRLVFKHYKNEYNADRETVIDAIEADPSYASRLLWNDVQMRRVIDTLPPEFSSLKNKFRETLGRKGTMNNY